MRCTFNLDGEVKRAVWHLCGLGYHVPWCNGRRVGDHVLDPAQTDYERRALFVTHDVTPLLRPGQNTLGVMLGNGWFHQDRVWGEQGLSYGPPRLIASLRIERSDGSTQTVVTDETWRCADGPVTDNNIYAGEQYDARLETPGWTRPDFDAASWQAVRFIDGPGGRLEPQIMPPIRRTQRLTPREIRKSADGAYLVDMGQNFAGWAEIRIHGERGATVQLRFAETLDEAGRLDTASTGTFATGVEQIDRYTCKGADLEIWEPRFTYHGFRYVEVTGWPGDLTDEDITGIVVHTDLKTIGRFSCSDPRLNQLHDMALWTHRSNIHGLPEDCPARERCGWLGDANIIAEMSMWNYDAADFWRKYIDDIETTRSRYDGLPASIAPGKRSCGAPAPPDWAAAFILVPWYIHCFTGETDVLARHHDGMRRLLEYFEEKADNWILGDGLGDWFDPGAQAIVTSTRPELTTTLWFLRCARVMARTAALLGHREDARRYEQCASAIGEAWRQRFYDAASGTCGSQTADAMALYFEVIPAPECQRVADAIATDIASRDNHLNVGIMGVRVLFEVLTRHGHGDLALKVLHQDSYPSFGDLIRRGATTLWEWWGEPKINNTRGPRSLNHPMFASYDNWFYNTLAGIELDEDRPGFKHVFIRPRVIPGLDWVKAEHITPLGRLAVAWRCENQRVSWQVEIPEGCEATFTPPGGGSSQVLSAGHHEG